GRHGARPSLAQAYWFNTWHCSQSGLPPSPERRFRPRTSLPLIQRELLWWTWAFAECQAPKIWRPSTVIVPAFPAGITNPSLRGDCSRPLALPGDTPSHGGSARQRGTIGTASWASATQRDGSTGGGYLTDDLAVCSTPGTVSAALRRWL